MGLCDVLSTVSNASTTGKINNEDMLSATYGLDVGTQHIISMMLELNRLVMADTVGKDPYIEVRIVTKTMYEVAKVCEHLTLEGQPGDVRLVDRSSHCDDGIVVSTGFAGIDSRLYHLKHAYFAGNSDPAFLAYVKRVSRELEESEPGGYSIMRLFSCDGG